MAAPPSRDHARLVRLLYRSLLRVARRFDAQPTTRYALHISPITGPPASWSYYHEAVADFLNNKLYLTPEASATPVASVVRKYFRVPEAPPQSPSSSSSPSSRRRQRARGAVGGGQEQEGQQQQQPQGTSVGDRLDAAFLALRELSKAWHSVEAALLPHMASASQAPGPASSSRGKRRKQQGEGEDEEAGALPFAVKSTRAVGPGVLLLAHPMMHDDVFKRAVIYLIEHSKKEGAYGLVVNQLSDMTLPQAVEGGLAPEFFQAFGKNALRRGGPVPRLQMLHQQEAIGGLPLARRGSPVVEGAGAGGGPAVPPPVFAGGDWKEATKRVRSGSMAPGEVHFFCGASTWAPGQLESEMQKGYWIPVKGPPHLALEHRPRMWYELLKTLGRQQREQEDGGAGASNGYLDAASLPEEGLDRVEPLAFD